MLLCCSQARFPRVTIGAAAIAEQLLENRSRIPLHRQRLRGTAPGERMRVDAAQIAGAGACVGRSIHGQLERSDLRFAGEVTGEQLVHRDVGDDFDFISAAVRGAREKRPGGAGVDVVPVCFDAGQHQHLIPERRQRFKDRGQFESRAFAFRRPSIPSPCRSERKTSGNDGQASRQARARDGSMASRNGSAIVAPIPRSMVRRGNDFAVRKVIYLVSFRYTF